MNMTSPTSATTSTSSFPRTLSVPATPYAAEENRQAASTRAKDKKDTKGKDKKHEGKVKVELDDDANHGYGGTEDEAPEAEAAKISPLKNGERLTSAVSKHITLVCDSHLKGSTGSCQV